MKNEQNRLKQVKKEHSLIQSKTYIHLLFLVLVINKVPFLPLAYETKIKPSIKYTSITYKRSESA